MHVVAYGNQDNLMFQYGRRLAEHGHTVTLLVDARRDERSQSHEDPAAVPANLEVVSLRQHPARWLWPGPRVLRILRRADLVLSSGIYVTGAVRAGRPVAHVAIGGDLTQLPFWRHSIRHRIAAWALRRALRRVDALVTAQTDCLVAADILGMRARRIRRPLYTDTEPGRLRSDEGWANALRARHPADLLLLCLARKNLDPHRPDFKGQDAILDALARLSPDEADRVQVVVAHHGNDAGAFAERLRRVWPPERTEVLPPLTRPELNGLFRLDRAVLVDQFGPVGEVTPGGLTKEALALGCPSITGTDTNARRFVQTYGPHAPILTAFDGDGIVARIRELLALDAPGWQELHDRSRAWVGEALSWQRHYPDLERELLEVAGRKEGR